MPSKAEPHEKDACSGLTWVINPLLDHQLHYLEHQLG